MNRTVEESHRTNLSPRTAVKRLRDSGVNEFGLALLAPLLDFVVATDVDAANDTLSVSYDNRSNIITHTPSFSKATITASTATTQSESTATTICCSEESDDNRLSEDDDDDSIINDAQVADEDAIHTSVRVIHECDVQLQTYLPILTQSQMNTIQQYLPYSIRDYYWDRIYNLNIHGDSFYTILQKCYGYKHSIVIIRTTLGHVLGGYASEEWQIYGSTNTSDISNSMNSNQGNHRFPSLQRRRNSYYGTGESFVFGCNNNQITDSTTNDSESLRVYLWTGKNDYCQVCDMDKSIMCMGGDGSFGWIISDNFTVGQTGYCATYNNPPLITTPTFDIADFEIYVLISPMKQFMIQNDVI